MTVRTSIRAPRGSELSCQGWPQEAAMRMLMNNLDPEVAERPEDLVVYGGTGKAARNWPCFDAIVSTDEDDRITTWNPATERIYGFRNEEILGHPVSMLAPARCISS